MDDKQKPDGMSELTWAFIKGGEVFVEGLLEGIDKEYEMVEAAKWWLTKMSEEEIAYMNECKQKAEELYEDTFNILETSVSDPDLFVAKMCLLLEIYGVAANYGAMKEYGTTDVDVPHTGHSVVKEVGNG